MTKKATEPKRGPGNPTLYKPEYDGIAQKMCQLGAIDDDLAEAFGVSRRAITRWRLANPSFAEASRVGKAATDDRIERSLMERAVGFTYIDKQAIKVKVGPNQERVEIVEVERTMPPDSQSGIFWLVNRRPDLWKMRRETNHTGVIQHETLSATDARAMIEKVQEKQAAEMRRKAN
jgi:hypothetical protein